MINSLLPNRPSRTRCLKRQAIAEIADHLRDGQLLVLRSTVYPGVTALVWAGYTYAAESWAINEHSNITAEGPPVYPFKTVIPLAGALVMMQGIVEIIRCVICLRQGYWPSREQDVVEVDVDKLKEMVHVKDEDIQKLDALVVRGRPWPRGADWPSDLEHAGLCIGLWIGAFAFWGCW